MNDSFTLIFPYKEKLCYIYNLTIMSLTGIIYRIEHKEMHDIRYIGSTLQELRYRWRDHKGSYKSWLNNKKRPVSIYEYFKEYGIENFKIIEIKSYRVCDVKHLKAYEQLWINKIKCINKGNSFGITKISRLHYRLKNREEINKKKREFHHQNKERMNEISKEYRKNNLEKVKQTNKEYYETNKNTDKFLNRVKDYNDRNKEKIKQYKSEWYEQNKGTTINCECGSKLLEKNLQKHLKSKKHLEFNA